jgi:hypothetical protein
VNGVVIALGCVERDMQIIVEECNNDRPDLIIPKDTCVEAGTLLTAKILGMDPNADPVRMEAFSEIFNLAVSPATFSPPVAEGQLPPLQSTKAPNDTANLKFRWQTDCEHVKPLSYQVVFKITDQPPGGPKLVTFKVWNIKVVAPAPRWVSANVDLSQRAVNLQWENYECENAIQMQVWRRVDSFGYTQNECETGMPDFLGYELIATVDLPGTTSYLDNNQGAGLSVGAAYCYRLVAAFPAPGDIPILGNLGGGALSYLSEEICVPPIEADAPVITHVSVEKTGTTDGQVRISWRSPFDINLAQFPKPFQYKVYRALGFSGNIQIQAAHPGFLSDTTFVDTGLNTEAAVYNYRVALYTPSGSTGNNPVDTSDVASTVRLETKSQVRKIELAWIADVPWSNRVQNYPYHRIYRGPEGSTESTITLIDSVNVNQLGFIYIDSGQYQNTPLKETELYCYRVMTRGSYGSPDIAEPQINFSQIICAQPSDEVPPCPVTVEVDIVDCQDFQESLPCGFNAFTNTLKWNRPVTGSCQNDVRYYNVYYATNTQADSADFELLATNVLDTFYIDQGLPSFARCYRVTAVDRSGNESEPSEIVCKDNCPYYELPNVFTPNRDGCNDLFSAFSDRQGTDEDGNPTGCGEVDKTKCARFVRKVNFTVYNRMGKEIYSYSSGGERTIYIDWDGRDGNGRELPAGVYYYMAEVTFDVVDPSASVREIKGWVQLIR